MTEHNGTALHYLSKTFPREKCVNLLDGPVMHSLFWHCLYPRKVAPLRGNALNDSAIIPRPKIRIPPS